MRLLISYIKRYRGIMALALVFAALSQVFSLLEPQITRLLLDNYVLKASTISQDEFIRGILVLMGVAILIALVARTSKTFQDYFVSAVTQKVGTDLYGDSVEHALSLPYTVFTDQRSGELLGKLQKARTDSEKLIIGAISSLFLSAVGIIFVLVYAFYVHWAIGLGYFLIIPIVAVTASLVSRSIKKIQSAIVIKTTDLSGSTTETLRNVELVKSLGLEEQETIHLNKVNTQILELELQKVKMVRKLNFIQGTIINLSRTGLLFLMFMLIYYGAMSFGEYFALTIYSFFVFNPLTKLGNVMANYQETKASMEEINKVLSQPSEPVPQNPIDIKTIEEISFKNVDFVYESSGVAAVSNINIDIKKGESVAFVGLSGSGKTTLIKLLLGLYKPSGGKLLINNEDANSINYKKFREHIGYVSQDTQLFAGTIKENLLFVKSDATDDECWEALRNAKADEVVNRSGAGLETKIGEGGIKLSGGERQRLAIARSLLRKPDLIVFDEATSSLDSLTEKEIIKTINEISKSNPDLIIVMIAHRLSTVSHVDSIFVMEKGQMTERGNHTELVDKKGLYYALWRSQSAG